MSSSNLGFIRGFLKSQQERAAEIRESLGQILATEETARIVFTGDVESLAVLAAIGSGNDRLQNLLNKVDAGNATEEEAIAEIVEIVKFYLIRNFDVTVNSKPSEVLVALARAQYWKMIASVLPL